MIKGITVPVRWSVDGETDDLGKPTKGYSEPEDVDNVLVSPASTDDIAKGLTRDGVRVSYRLCFPKTFNRSLKGAQVKVGDDWLDIVGDPKPFMAENCPTDWWLTAEAGVIHG